MAYSSKDSQAGGGLRSRLERMQAAGFIGRERELQAFRDCLDPSSPCRVLLLHGPGGMGKTTLLGAFARHAREQG
ncbi:MAG TPA: ATP-binding protein, partial [Gammaproteobacteria bacterium]|nr:ATP-binding protein [Gammaproteobacteria bacterium]